MRYYLTGIVVFMAFFLAGNAFSQDAFIDLQGTHFVVRYTMPDEKAAANDILRRAEQCYARVSGNIGFTRYTDFWTWEKRVKIILFPDQIAYTRFTGQSQWSRAYASRNSMLFRDRVIVTYAGQPEMSGSILPHEIAHLVLWDLLSDKALNIPVWFEEGVAQLEEEGKRQLVQEAIRPVVVTGKYIHFKVFNDLKTSELSEDSQLALFYAQSLSVVVFLIEKYGQDAFYRLSKELRNGLSFERALVKIYGGVFSSLSDLESRWVKYVTALSG